MSDQIIDENPPVPPMVRPGCCERPGGLRRLTRLGQALRGNAMEVE
jgi:hypothetical protein